MFDSCFSRLPLVAVIHVYLLYKCMHKINTQNANNYRYRYMQTIILKLVRTSLPISHLCSCTVLFSKAIYMRRLLWMFVSSVKKKIELVRNLRKYQAFFFVSFQNYVVLGIDELTWLLTADRNQVLKSDVYYTASSIMPRSTKTVLS